MTTKEEEEPHLKSSRELIKYAFDKHTEEVLNITGEDLNKAYKKKFEKSKGRTITVSVFCNSCTEKFTIKGKSNKSDTTEKQLCSHLILKNWEVDLGSS